MPRKAIVVTVGLISLAGLTLYVPWMYTLNETRSYASSGTDKVQWERAAGYGFIFSPPARGSLGLKIDLARLLIPMGVVVFATLVGLFLVPDKRLISPAQPPGQP